MNRTAYASVLALIFSILVFSTGCCPTAPTFSPVTVITATSGTPQTAFNDAPFAAPLVATVTLNGGPAVGVTVSFTAPGAGASGTFADSTTSNTTATTDSNGVATSAVFTANGTSGAYTVTALVPAASTPADFNLTNALATGATITITGGDTQSATVSTAFALPLAVQVLDGDSNPVPGVQVTFTAPASLQSGTFANSTATETDTTDSTGTATSSTFTANTTAGPYMVTAAVAGVSGTVSFTLTNTP
jgi:hypothetical protein